MFCFPIVSLLHNYNGNAPKQKILEVVHCEFKYQGKSSLPAIRAKQDIERGFFFIFKDVFGNDFAVNLTS